MNRFATGCRVAAVVALQAALAFSVTGIGAGLAGGFAAQAQARGPMQRIVHGKVQNKDGTAIKGAVVYLQDNKSSSVKTAIADDNGDFRFVQLTQDTEYQLWAKSGGKQSKTRSISSFDDKNDMLMNLTID